MERWNDKWDDLASDSDGEETTAAPKWKATEEPKKEVKNKVCACCGKDKGELKACTQCKRVVYCDRLCQKKNWAFHRVRCGSELEERLLWLELWEPTDPGMREGEDVAHETKSQTLPTPDALMDLGKYAEEMSKWVTPLVDNGDMRRFVEKCRGRRLIMYIERHLALKRLSVDDIKVFDHHDINETIAQEGALFRDKVRRLGSEAKAAKAANYRKKIFYLTLRRIYTVNPQENFLLVYTDSQASEHRRKRKDDMCMKFPFDSKPGNYGRFVGR